MISSKHAELVSLACKTALIERDVAHLIFPDDVQTIPSDAPAEGPGGRMAGAAVVPSEVDLAAAAKLIDTAKRPIFVVGHGAIQSREVIIALAEKLGAPVITTF